MSEKNKKLCTITSQERLSTDVYSMWIQAEDIAKSAKAGQFVSLFCDDGSKLLPRPISICEIDSDQGLIRLVYRVVGSGTKEFAGLKSGDSIAVMGPLGNGFADQGGKALLIGGGVGIPPMVELAKQLAGEKAIVIGYRDQDTFLVDDLKQYGELYLATEDGSLGTKGNVLDAIREHNITADVIYACGPTPMLRAIKQYAAEHQIRCYLSLEERMACGIGACLACVCKTTAVDAHTHVNKTRICKEGPVFEASEVEL